MDLNLLNTFLKVAELGSFTKAAAYLRQPKSRVSRAISRLEEELHTELIKRSTRKLQLTPAGCRLFQNTRPLIDQLNQEAQTLAASAQDLSGKVRFSAPEDIASLLFGVLLAEFMETYPQIDLELVLSAQYLDPVGERLDFAIRVGNLKDSSLKQVRVGQIRLVLAASPSYLKTFGQPTDLAALTSHKILAFLPNHQPQGGEPAPYELLNQTLAPLLVCNSFGLLMELLLRDKGIALLPDYYCRSEMFKGRLVRLLPDLDFGGRNLQILCPPAKVLSPRTRVCLDFFASRLSPFFA